MIKGKNRLATAFHREKEKANYKEATRKYMQCNIADITKETEKVNMPSDFNHIQFKREYICVKDTEKMILEILLDNFEGKKDLQVQTLIM